MRWLTIALALWYFFAAATHAGFFPAVGAPLPVAPLVEGALGLVLLATLARLPLVWGCAIALAGTLFGLAIVLARGLFGIDLVFHLVMLAGLAFGFALIFRGRTRPT